MGGGRRHKGVRDGDTVSPERVVMPTKKTGKKE